VNAGSLFSGVGGLDLGLHRAGIPVAWQCEIDPWRRTVLAHHWPAVRCAEDVCQVAPGWVQRSVAGVLEGERDGADARRSRPWPPDGHVDLLCGGFPCQDVSVAGRRAGLDGQRSGLFFEYARIAAELAPAWILIENVPGLLSSADGRDFALVLATLADLGYGLAWRVLDARYFGVPQRRRRVFIAGRAGGDPEPALQALVEGGDRDPAAGRCSWQNTPARARTGAPVAGPITRRHGKGVNTTADDGAVVVGPLRNPGDGGTGLNAEQAAGGNLVVSALDRQAGGPDDNAAQAAHLVAFHATQEPVNGPISPALGANSYMGVNHAGVRRLTPLECERLMSWPDDWTNPDGTAPDSRRYAACGDGVVANVAEWIGRRIIAVEEET